METLYTLIARVKECFGVQLCVHDVSGVTYSRKSLNLPYLWMQHDCEYCSVTKQCLGEKRCMLQKQLVMWKLRRNGCRPFFGVCYAGVCEYILPVERSGQLLAVIYASGLAREDEEASRCKAAQAAARALQAQRAQMTTGYEAFAAGSAVSRETLRFLAELVRERILRADMDVAGANDVDPYAVESVRQGHSGTVRAILGYIEASLPGTITLADLSAVFFMSEGHLCRIFRQEMGMSIMAYVKRLRVKTAERLLRESDESVSAVALRVGIADANYFCRMFKRVTGLTPTEYRNSDLDGSMQGQNGC